MECKHQSIDFGFVHKLKNSAQHTTTYGDLLQHTPTFTATYLIAREPWSRVCSGALRAPTYRLRYHIHAAAYCSIHTTAFCNTLQNNAAHYTATYCDTLQRTATHSNPPDCPSTIVSTSGSYRAFLFDRSASAPKKSKKKEKFLKSHPYPQPAPVYICSCTITLF